MRVRLFLATLLALCLFQFACGSGGTNQSSPPASPPPSPPPQSPGPTSWNYTALGDSLAFGILAVEGYVPRYASYLQTDNGVTVSLSNLGHNGWRSSDLLNALKTDNSLRSSIQISQVVTWDIGGDDLLRAHADFYEDTCGGSDGQDCLRNAVSTFEPNWDAILAELLSLRSRQTTILRTMNVYNPFVAEDVAAGNFDMLNTYLNQLNEYIENSAARNSIQFADIHAIFNGASGTEDPISKGYISLDGVHPNDQGHKAIADSLRALQYAPLK